LLRALLGAAFEFLDLLLHGEDGLFLFRDLQSLLFLGFLACLLARGGEPFLDALLNRELHFPFGIVQLALLADQIRLRLLRLGELDVALLENII